MGMGLLFGSGTGVLQVLLLALVLDAVFGDPEWLYRRVPHPVVLIGRLISAGEAWNDESRSRSARFRRGLILTLAVTLLAAAVGWGVAAILQGPTWGWLFESVLVSTLVAWRGLLDYVRAVAVALARSLIDGRAAVAKIVGRDPATLDRAGVARAAVESLAENFSDGVVAPAFWYLLLGLPGLAAYKAINTLDSMIGHRSARYEAFGKAAARLDDAANWLPARLSGLLLAAAALFLPKAGAGSALATMLRDAPRHRSVNAGWQEAALAGALGFALAGPRQYGDHAVDDPWMGDGRRDLGPADIRRALQLVGVAGALILVATLVALLAT